MSISPAAMAAITPPSDVELALSSRDVGGFEVGSWDLRGVFLAERRGVGAAGDCERDRACEGDGACEGACECDGECACEGDGECEGDCTCEGGGECEGDFRFLLSGLSAKRARAVRSVASSRSCSLSLPSSSCSGVPRLSGVRGVCECGCAVVVVLFVAVLRVGEVGIGGGDRKAPRRVTSSSLAVGQGGFELSALNSRPNRNAAICSSRGLKSGSPSSFASWASSMQTRRAASRAAILSFHAARWAVCSCDAA